MDDKQHVTVPPDQVLRWMSAYLDEQITDAEFFQLSKWIVASPANARWFARVGTIHSGVRCTLQQKDLWDFLNAGDGDDDLNLAVDPQNIRDMLQEAIEADRRKAEAEAMEIAQKKRAEAEAEQARQRELERMNRVRRPQPIEIPRSAVILALAASVLIVGFVSQALLRDSDDVDQQSAVVIPAPAAPEAAVTVASISASMEARWGEGNVPAGPGGRLALGKFVLEEGAVEIAFDDGAEVVGESPFELDIISSGKMRLTRGRIVAKVPQEAIGFTVTTAAGAIVDLGTEFGVHSSESGNVDVHVLDGAVALTTKETQEGVPPITLAAGTARRLNRDGSPVSAIDFEGSDFLRSVPATPYELAIRHDRPLCYWRFDNSSPAISSLGKLESVGLLGAGVSLEVEPTNRGVARQMATFDGSHDGISLTESDALNLTHSFTIETWVKPSALGEMSNVMRILSTFFRTNGAEGGYAMGIANEGFIGSTRDRHVLAFTFHGVYDAISTTSLELDRWMHLAVVVDANGRPRMYVDGSEVEVFMRSRTNGVGTFEPMPAKLGATHQGMRSGNPCFIGRHPLTNNEGNPPEQWQGSIDEIAVFDRMLTAEEIARHYSASNE